MGLDLKQTLPMILQKGAFKIGLTINGLIDMALGLLAIRFIE